MSNATVAECEVCGSRNLAPGGDCKDCGNANRKPHTTGEGHAHEGWYQLEKKLEEEEAKPHAPPAELPENMKVPQHQGWYDLAGTAPPGPRAPPPPVNTQVSTMIRYAIGGLIVVLLGTAGYLLFAMQQPVPVGLGH